MVSIINIYIRDMNFKLREMRIEVTRMLASRYPPRTTRRILIFTSSICILVSLMVSSISASSNFSTNITSSHETSNKSAALSKTLSSKSANTGEQQVVIVEPQQSQSTDVSSMYVQIPIAEPSETGVPDGVQQTLTNESDGSSGQDGDNGQSKWTGPWPKKFQIGYIKQSDLHQVLIESLKGDPFTSLTSPTTKLSSSSGSSTGQQQQNAGSSSSTPAPPTKSLTPTSASSTKSSGPSDSSSLMSGSAVTSTNQGNPNWPQTGYNSVSSRSPAGASKGGNLYLSARQTSLPSAQSAHSNFRDSKVIQQAMQQMVHRQFHQYGNNQPQAGRFPLASRHFPVTTNFGQQHHQQNYVQQQQQQQQPQQQQFQFAGYPTNFAKNQPMYMINNFPTQEQVEMQQNPLLIQQQQQQQIPFTNQILTRNQQKPAGDYYSSWRPVSTSSDSKFEQQTGSSRPVFQTQEYGSSFADEFDDGFTTPVRTEPPPSLANMNRHPMLNNYLPSDGPSTSGAGKTSASTKSRPRALSPPPSTKGGSRSETTKGSGQSNLTPTDFSEKNLTVSGRRGLTNTTDSSTTTTTTPSSLNSSSTESSSTQGSTNASVGSTIAPTSSTTSVMSTTLSSANTESSETTEPDSETVDSELETTEPSAATTTTLAASTATSLSSDSGSTTEATKVGNGSTRSDESEVATQSTTSTRVGTASLPSVDDNVVTTSSTVREETTPASAAAAAAASNEQATKIGPTKVGEVEGSMSDEALQAVAVRSGSEIGKNSNGSASQSLTQSASSTVRAKQTRSSDRLQLQSQQQTSRRKNTSSQVKGAGKGQRETSANSTKSSTNIGSTKSRVLSSARSGKQVGKESKDSNSTKTGRQIKTVAQKKSSKNSTGGSGVNSTSSKIGSKATRMVPQSQSQQQQQQQQQPQQSERLQAAPQIVSMSAAQAQSTAQTLASLLLSRCMSSTSCAHLLDVCSTKQAAVPLSSLNDNNNNNNNNNNNVEQQQGAIGTNSSAWSMPVGLPSSGLMNLAQALQADRSLRLFPQWKEACENLIDQGAQTGYTLILPSNEAIDRLPASTLAQLQASSDSLNQLIENHMLDSAEMIELHSSGNSFKSSQEQQQLQSQNRLIRNKGLQVNQHRDRMVTINGKRLVYANQQAPAGGRIHVIDGLLDYPTGGSQAKLLDIMDTLKQCDKFDGFVTLAEGTGLTQILKQDGPMTVFVPSNEALRKIPDEELEVIKNNSTALKEFLMYHVVNGSYFSQDLRDGQQLTSILDMKPIQVGVRVDGCSRRLVEANTSPMRRPDIVAKNGVIHILDWYLTVRDNEWCDPIGRSPVINSPPDTSSSSSSSERLQQLASESNDAYATRLVIPANHKPAHNTGISKQHHNPEQQLVATNQQQYSASTLFASKNHPNQLSHSQTTSSNEFEKPHDVFVSAISALDQVTPEKKA